MKIIGKILRIFLLVIAAAAIILVIINQIVKSKAEPYLVDPENAGTGYDCIMVLGCSAANGTPSDMLRDRLQRGVELYKNGVSAKLLMSGDHGKEDYDEVNVMKGYAMENGVPDEDIFMDHAGFSTYESMYRAKEIFKVEKMLIVTQPYHLYRAVYDARKMGIDAYGTESMPNTYVMQKYNDVREFLARDKDFLWCIIKPEPTYLGDSIPVQGSGKLTNDK